MIEGQSRHKPSHEKLAECLPPFLEITGLDLSPAGSKDQIPFVNVFEVSDANRVLREGDHLAILMKPGSYHHVIWEGDGFVVDHGPSVNGKCVQRRPWAEVLKQYYSSDGTVYRLHYDDNAADDRRRAAVAIASHFWKSNSLRYALHGCNCEAFASFCWTQRWCAPRVQSLRVRRSVAVIYPHPKWRMLAGKQVSK